MLISTHPFGYCMVIYPSVEEIQLNNTVAIEMFRRSKKDQAKTISVGYLQKVIDMVIQNNGDLYDKAAQLLIELTRIHAFESGNKRTAFLSCKRFVLNNNRKFNIPDETKNANIMIGIRGYIPKWFWIEYLTGLFSGLSLFQTWKMIQAWPS